MKSQEKRYPPSRTFSWESLNQSAQKRNVAKITRLRRPEIMEDTRVLLLLDEAAANDQDG